MCYFISHKIIFTHNIRAVPTYLDSEKRQRKLTNRRRVSKKQPKQVFKC